MTSADETSSGPPAGLTWIYLLAGTGLLLFVALVGLRAFVFRPVLVSSASMEPTLLAGDYVVVDTHDRTVQRGDVVVFKLPRDNRTLYIHRLIGLPSDRIQMRDGRLRINDKAVEREPLKPVSWDVGYGYKRQVDRARETLPGGKSFITHDFGPDGEMDNTAVYVVPAGHYFFLGDNRDNALDSRAPKELGVGYVPAENLVGKARMIVFSTGAEGARTNRRLMAIP